MEPSWLVLGASSAIASGHLDAMLARHGPSWAQPWARLGPSSEFNEHEDLETRRPK